MAYKVELILNDVKHFQGWQKLSLNNKVACPLDCYDACQAEIIEENIKVQKSTKQQMENFVLILQTY